MIRDAKGAKMSKSVGNVVDPIHIIEGRSLEALQEEALQSASLPELVPPAADGVEESASEVRFDYYYLFLLPFLKVCLDIVFLFSSFPFVMSFPCLQKAFRKSREQERRKAETQIRKSIQTAFPEG